jgi:DoxX-like family
MNILLWVLQVVLALLCIAGGIYQIFKIDELAASVAAMRELPRSLWALLGAIGIVAGLALILPGAFKVMPAVTPFAAAAVAAESVLISAIYLYYGDSSPLPYSVAMAVMAAFIAYGRFTLAPF